MPRGGLLRPSADTEAAAGQGTDGMETAGPEPEDHASAADTPPEGAHPPDGLIPPHALEKADTPRRRRHWGRWLAGGVMLLVATAGGGAGFAWLSMQADGPSAARSIVIVPHGGLSRVADALHDAGVIDSPLLFRAAAEVTRWQGASALHAAELEFPPHASVMTVLRVLRTARPVQHTITFPEGVTAARVADILARDPVLTGEVPVPPEGSILPQTYTFERGATRQQIAERAEEAARRLLSKAWAGRSSAVALVTPEQAVILASIVERETARPQERPHVAAVFLNRLKRGMRLQADSTLVYAASGGSGQLERPLSRADLAYDQPYNTYKINGLPPAPIGNPGQAALEAVLHPAVSDDLYFVADGAGGHNFARDLNQHELNVRRWRDGQRAR